MVGGWGALQVDQCYCFEGTLQSSLFLKAHKPADTGHIHTHQGRETRTFKNIVENGDEKLHNQVFFTEEWEGREVKMSILNQLADICLK